MKKFSLIAITAACLATALSAQAALIQHLIATNGSPSVLVNGSGTVTNWLDISGNGNDTANAGAIVSTPKWPSTSLAASGESGVDMLTTRAGLRAWSVPAQNAWLDFTGLAAGNSGFAVLVAFKADGITGSWNPIFANHGNPLTLNSFNLSTQSDGQLVFAALGTVYPRSGPKVTAGDTVVVAFNYNAATGAYEYWDSKNSSSAVGTIAANGNFSSVQVVYLGTSENGGQWLNGMIGEVKVYNNLMTTNDFTNAYQDLVARWVTPTSAILPPTVSAIGGDSQVFLNWADNNTSGAVSDFYVYRSLDSGSNYVSIATNATTSFTDTGLINGTDYYYVVKALGTNGTLSAFSAEASATPVTIGTNAVLYQWLDASVSNSVITLFGDLLEWGDLTTNLNNATPDIGVPVYPSASLSGSSLAGVDMLTNRTGIQLFSSAAQPSLLDFTGSAKTNGGFSALVAFKADAVETTAKNTVLVNHGNPAEPSSFGLKFDASGAMQAFLGGTTYTKAGNAVQDGDTVVYALSYDDQTGAVEFWDSKNTNSLVVTNQPFAKLSSIQRLRLGTSDNNGQWFNGMIGEVKIYQGKLDSAALVAEGQLLATKWGATPPPPPVVISTNVELLVQLDATLPASVDTNAFGEVISWLDQTTNANDAVTQSGFTILYPSVSLSASGKAGLDFGTNKNNMILFNPGIAQDQFLDYTGIYSNRTGFAVLVAFKADSIQPGNIRNPVLANNGNALDPKGFGLRYSDSGQMEVFAGGQAYYKSGAVVAPGDTIVYAFNYDSVTGGFEFWDSKNNSSLNGATIPKGNFSSSQNFYIGSSLNPSQFMDGMVGEVKIYTGKLDASTFQTERDALAVKWGTAVANTNADLADLVLSDGTLTPGFDSGVFTYTASVANSVTNISITPTTAYYSTFVEAQVNGGGYIYNTNLSFLPDGYPVLSSGYPIGPLALNEGANTVDVQVTAQNPAFTQTYTVTVTRAAGAPAPEPIMTTVSGGSLILNWTDPSWKLATGTNVTAITNIVSGAASPYTNSLGSEPQRYFRLVYP